MPQATGGSDGWSCAARRAVLLGLAAGAVALTGCGGDKPAASGDSSGIGGTAVQPGAAEQPGAPERSTGAGQAGAAPSAQPGSRGNGASPRGGTSAEPTFEPFPTQGSGGIVKTSDVPVGGAVVAADYLVAQPQRGVFKAYESGCPHQGVTVDPPMDGTDYFNCPGHNSKFRLGDGSRISGPAPRGLRQVAVKVKDGYVVEA